MAFFGVLWFPSVSNSTGPTHLCLCVFSKESHQDITPIQYNAIFPQNDLFHMKIYEIFVRVCDLVIVYIRLIEGVLTSTHSLRLGQSYNTCIIFPANPSFHIYKFDTRLVIICTWSCQHRALR